MQRRRRRRPPRARSPTLSLRARAQVGFGLATYGFGFLPQMIFVLYAPGLVFYVLKKPKRPDFGFHEYFHTSVLLGHMCSMLLDLREVVRCAIRCGGGAGLV